MGSIKYLVIILLLLAGNAHAATVIGSAKFTTYSTNRQAEINSKLTASNAASLTNKTINDFSNFVDSDAVHVKFWNNTGSTITAGTALYMVGWDATNLAITVGLARSDSSATMPCIGVAESTTVNSAYGDVRVVGALTGLNTNTWSTANHLYVSPTVAGGLQNTRPTGANYVQEVAVVARQHATLGVINVYKSALKDDVGLGNVDNTADVNKAVLSATKLATARTINGTSFDGTANITVADATKEPALGNPASNGYVLSSTTAGTRSWIAAGGAGTPASTVTTEAYGSAAVVGTSTNYAREDHTHAMPATTKDTTAITGLLKGNGTAVSAATVGTDYSLINGTGFVKAAGTVLSYDASTYSLSSHTHAGVYEPVLGNPASNGQVLSSTTAGVRSWITAGGGTPATTVAVEGIGPTAVTGVVGVSTNYAREDHVHATNAVQPVYSATLSNGTVALNFSTNNTVTVTPTITGTFTTTIPANGVRCNLIVITSGTTSYTMTFGTGFKTVGTLTTGTVTGKYFAFSFISNGSLLVETSRTTAM